MRERPRARRQTRAMRRFIIVGVIVVEVVEVVESLWSSRTTRRGRTAMIFGFVEAFGGALGFNECG